MVVVGAGNAVLHAALAAHQAGAHVLALEPAGKAERGVLDREVTPRQFTFERRAAPELSALIGEIALVRDPEINQLYPDRFAGRVTIELKSGQTLVATVDASSGSPSHSHQDSVFTKFRGLTEGLVSHATQEQILTLLRFGADDVPIRSELNGLLTFAGSDKGDQ